MPQIRILLSLGIQPIHDSSSMTSPYMTSFFQTMLAKAVAHHTTASFIRVVGSEFVQKYLGEGPRMVRDVFQLARENSPAIIFIDEVDAIATRRFDAKTRGTPPNGHLFLTIRGG